MRPLCVLAAAFALTFNSPAAHAEEELHIELLWLACPYLLGTAAEVALRRLHLPLDEVEGIADLTCNVAQAYEDIAADPSIDRPADPRTAEEIFCEGSSASYCAGVAGAAAMSPEMRCWMDGLTQEACAVATIRSEAGR